MNIKTLIVAAALTVAGTAAHANDAARFELRNASGQTIDVVQVSAASDPYWSPDLLGNRVLPSGASAIVTPGAAGCMFDVQVIYHDRTKEGYRNINLCRTTRISFARNGG